MLIITHNQNIFKKYHYQNISPELQPSEHMQERGSSYT